MRTSVFDLFKIGIGPSSSHTVGPMRAALRFTKELESQHLLEKTARLQSELYGSLALTGLGHGTDRAILLGLAGETPEEVQVEKIDSLITRIRSERLLRLLGVKAIVFEEERDLLFHRDEVLPGHPNGMRFSAFDSMDCLLLTGVFYSIGGGFVVKEGEPVLAAHGGLPVPYPFSNAAELLLQADNGKLAIWQLML